MSDWTSARPPSHRPQGLRRLAATCSGLRASGKSRDGLSGPPCRRNHNWTSIDFAAFHTWVDNW